ncbi:MAG: cation transporter [Deltaproteobacteria bacterium]|nr:cation transporter [Deltaproteobacteria bacterium]MBW2084916.1 cation transporter [Deltaproteobacteria bacterium]
MVDRLKGQTLDDLYGPETVEAIQPGEVDIERVYWILFWANLGLAFLKITVGALGYSRLLIIDGLNSAANAMVITTILFGERMSHPGTMSKKYPYGKGKAQYLAASLVGILLAAGASVILALSVKTFFSPNSFEPTGIGLATALISVGGNLMLIRFLKYSGLPVETGNIKKIARLQTLNIAASCVVILALLLGGIFGWFIAERMGSISISLLVLWLSLRIKKSALDGIMDRSADKRTNSRISTLVSSLDEVEKVRWIRTRHVGQNLLVNLYVGLKGDCSTRLADQISERIRERLSSNMERISHVSVHFYPV